MTVRELIDKLEEVEYKSLEVRIYSVNDFGDSYDPLYIVQEKRIEGKNVLMLSI